MNTTQANKILKTKGYEKIFEVSFPGNHINDTHTHPFDAEIIIIKGSISITVNDNKKLLTNGDRLALSANTEHSEHVGPDGVTFLAGRNEV